MAVKFGVAGAARARAAHARRGGWQPGPHYKWIALSNTTLGVLMATINQSIVLIALPDIFRGIGVNPLSSGNTGYLLWMFMGFLVVSAVLVVSFGRLGDMFGRVRMYNIGFAVFTVASIFLAATWMTGTDAALWLIIWRIVQGIGGAFLFANSTAILTDAFPANQRGTALGMNAIAAIAGSFLGLLLGGVLAPINWHFVFLVSVPFGLFGTFWAYFMLHDLSERHRAKMDWWGNVLFAAGLIAILVGITYGLEPYGGHAMGWTSPFVLCMIFGGLAALVVFCFVETRVAEPMFRLSLFRIRAFAAGNLANLMIALGRGGMQFTLIIWLQGIWLPLHGYSFSQTPLWAGTIGHLPPIGVLFAAFLGYNPMKQLLGPLLGHLPASHAAYLTGRDFFPNVITHPFHSGLGIAFWFAIAANVVAAFASVMTGPIRRRAAADREPVGEELAAVAGEGTWEPSELVLPAADEADASRAARQAAGAPRAAANGAPAANGANGTRPGPGLAGSGAGSESGGSAGPVCGERARPHG